MKRRNRDADNLSFRLDKAADVIPIIWEHLDEQRALAATCSGGHGEGRQGGTHSDPTLRSFMKLNRIDEHRQEIRDALASINVGVRLLEEACSKALGVRVFPAERSDRPEPPRCSATNRDGAIEWSDPTCTNVPTRGPLCDKCSKREYRWRVSRGLPPRRDGVFSVEGAA